MGATVQWNGPAVVASVSKQVDDRMESGGQVGVETALSRVPVRTGELRDSIGYTYNPFTKTLRFFANAWYAGFPEFGTRRQYAQPYFRPAVNAMMKLICGVATLDFITAPQRWNTATPDNPKAVAHNRRVMKRFAKTPVGQTRHVVKRTTGFFPGKTPWETSGRLKEKASRF